MSRTRFLATAAANVGRPYRWGGADPQGFDCSGFVSYCYQEATGQSISRDSHAQYLLGEAVSQIEPGDLLFYDSQAGAEVRLGNAASHVAIALDSKRMVHALNAKEGVVISKIGQKWFRDRLLGARRLPFPEEVAEPKEEPKEEPVPELKEPQPKPKIEASTSRFPNPPQGTILTPDPKGHPFTFAWSQINQYDQLIAQAADEFRVPFGRLKTIIPIESGGERRAVQQNNRNGWSYGLCQIVPYTADPARQGWEGWHALIRRIAVLPENSSREQVIDALYDPAISLRVAAAILRQYYDQHGSWDAANSCFFTGKPGWLGADSVNGTRGGDYKRCLDGLLGEIWAADDGTQPGTPPGSDPWRPYPWPKMLDLLITKPGEGAGFTRVAHRGPRIRGFCTHITEGGGSLEWLRDFFSTGGERAWDAMVDTAIDARGRIALYNDWRDPNRGGTRAGWANGGVDGLEEEGVAFYRSFPDINSHLVSCEHIRRTGERWSDAMIAATVELRTAIAQSLQCPWDAYPYHPAYGGVSIEQKHRNFATKPCPANPYISEHDAIVRREVKANLKDWQGGISSEPTDPAPDWVGPYGLPVAFFANEFGLLKKYSESGTFEADLAFDPRGPVSLAWLKRGEEEGVWPEAQELRIWDSTLAPGKEQWISFSNGWRLWLPIDNGRAGWQWLDQPAS